VLSARDSRVAATIGSAKLLASSEGPTDALGLHQQQLPPAADLERADGREAPAGVRLRREIHLLRVRRLEKSRRAVRSRFITGALERHGEQNREHRCLPRTPGALRARAWPVETVRDEQGDVFVGLTTVKPETRPRLLTDERWRVAWGSSQPSGIGRSHSPVLRGIMRTAVVGSGGRVPYDLPRPVQGAYG